MTILPKKKAEQESDSDGDLSPGSPHESSPHGPVGHAPLGSPGTPEEVGYHDQDGFYHRRYDLSSSSGESSPELPSLSKRLSYRSPPAATASSGTRGKKPLDTSPGYNSSEEYDGSHRPYVDPERERQFENALRKERGLVMKRMRPDGACLFRAVADQVYGDQEMHAVVRNHCMDYMFKNMDYFSQYISGEDFEHYIDRKRRDQCYGNNIEMQALAEMYSRPIEVFQYSTEPINIFFGVYKTDSTPIRLSYHGSIHYNSVIDPYNATIGVGLGLAGHKPGIADKTQVIEAQRESENVHIEQTMLEDKMKSTDWDATYDAIEEAVARESYLTWLREDEKRAQHEKLTGSLPSSSACRGNSPPMASTSYSPRPLTKVGGGTPITTTCPSSTNSKKSSSVGSGGGGCGGSGGGGTNTRDISTTSGHAKTAAENKFVKSRSSVQTGGSSSPNSPHHHHHRHHRHHHRGGSGMRRFTPSPPSSAHHHHHHRGGSGLGTGTTATVRNAPYYSPRDSPRNGEENLRGSARNSPRTSPRNSFYGDGWGGDPPATPPLKTLDFSPRNIPSSCSSSSSSDNSPDLSPSALPLTRQPLLVNLSSNEDNNPPPVSPSSPAHSPHPRGGGVVIVNTLEGRNQRNSPPNLDSERTFNDVHLAPPTSTPPPSEGEPRSPSPNSGSQSPLHTLDFEDGRVLSQLPYEYSSFLDLPPSALGLSEWEDDRVLAAVLAASQQEYIDSLRRHSRGPPPGGQDQDQ